MKWLFNLMVTSLLFFPEKDFYALPKDYGLSEEEVFFTTQDSVKLHGWFFSAPQSKAVLLFFHGNAGNISGRLHKAKGWVERGISVFLVDYRGYGKSEGSIKEGEDLLEDARSALKWLEEKKGASSQEIILYGESVGSYPAIALAREKKFAGLVLEAPFTNVLELARKHYSWVPDFLLKDFLMRNEDAIPQVQAPVFILHGDQDEICPVEFGGRLYELAPSPKEFYVVQGGHHNDLPDVARDHYFEYPFRFISEENHYEN